MNITTRKLGRLPVVHDLRTISLSRILIPANLPTPPTTWDGTGGLTSFGMMLNATLSCCTISAAGHLEQIWTAAVGKEVTLLDSAILTAYEKATGYKPGHPDTDQGAVELDVLKFWRKTGIGGRKITAFTFVGADPASIREAAFIFDGLYIGLALPLSAQTQKVWDVPKSGTKRGPGVPGSWGGHAVCIVGYTDAGAWIITWGELQFVTWAFLAAYCEERYAIISADYEKNGKCPAGVNWTALVSDLAAVAN